ncbi:UNVERIFIED_CONTAM: hypothetical protein Sindi_0658500 [Sesamum indicum]
MSPRPSEYEQSVIPAQSHESATIFCQSNMVQPPVTSSYHRSKQVVVSKKFSEIYDEISTCLFVQQPVVILQDNYQFDRARHHIHLVDEIFNLNNFS